MLSFLKKYYLYGILGLIGLLAIIALNPALTSWIFTRTSPPVKVYKAVPFEKRENSHQGQVPRQAGTEKRNPLAEKQPAQTDASPGRTEITENDNFDNNQVSDETTAIEEVTLPLAKRKRKDISPEVAAAEQRRKESERLRQIEKEMRSIAPLIKEDRDIMLRFLDLQEEKLKIHQNRGTLHTDGHNPFFLIKVERLLLRATTDGKIPVSLGEELASLFVENGHTSGAAQIRRATQRAFENGERFFKSEHLKDSE